MASLAERVDAAIRASGRTGEQIADALDVDPNTISRIRTGREDNPKLQLLIGIARETGTTVPALLGASIGISAEDRELLDRLRGWIDDKLSIDAFDEPNGEIISAPPALVRETRIADRSYARADHPFGEKAQLVVRAIGESMIDSGILPGDTIYAMRATPATSKTAAGKIVVCRLGDATFVKRLATEHGRAILLSAHPRYRPIAVANHNAPFEILGIVIGRVGPVT